MSWRSSLIALLLLAPLAASAAKGKAKSEAKPAPAATAPAEAAKEEAPKAEAAPEAKAAAPADEATTNKEKAKIHFQAGAAFYRESRYDDAIREFVDAYAYDRNPVLVFNIAQAHEKAGRIPEALRFYSQYVHDAPKAADRTTVEISIRNLEAHLAQQGVQQVEIYSNPAGATAAVDNKVLGPTPISADLPPGKHHLTVSLADHKTVERDFGLSKGHALDIEITMEQGSGTVAADPVGDLTMLPLPPLAEEKTPQATANQAAAKAAVTEAPPPPPTPFQKIKLPGLIAAGAGVALLAVGAAYQIGRGSLESQAATETVQTKYAALSTQAHSDVTKSRVTFALGGVAVAAGGALILLDLGVF